MVACVKHRRSMGHLHDNLQTLAASIQARLGDGAHIVWADDTGEVHLAPSHEAPFVPQHWIAGIFELGLPTAHIEDDLRTLLQERSCDWILD